MITGSEHLAPFISIRLANGQQWSFRPTDTESDTVIRRLAAIMNLSPSPSGREIFVSTCKGNPEGHVRVPNQHPLICIIPSGTDDTVQVDQYRDLARVIALETLPAGGLLIHGALAEYNGYGVILAGISGIGKTTASYMLKQPWHSLSDDETLVVRDETGVYHAHPWPTWSRFYDRGPGSSWEVERAVPLIAIFFLSQSTGDYADPMLTEDAIEYLMASIRHPGIPSEEGICSGKESESLYTLELAAVIDLTRAIPAYHLRFSLTGCFWEVIAPLIRERTLDIPADKVGMPSGTKKGLLTGEISPSGTDMFGAGHIPIVYHGPSMNPTLKAPDLLDVVPYGKVRPAIGDIICFYPPGDDMVVVHRIIRISRSGIQTQGDNNQSADSALLQEGQIIGRVIGATRGSHRRTVASGTLGRFTYLGMQVRRLAASTVYNGCRLLRPTRFIALVSVHLVPRRWKPRVVLFPSRKNMVLRLYFGSKVIGEYNVRRGSWNIRFPFQLFIDERILLTLEENKS
jgi:SynChlorMet cassette protein ScmC